MDKLFSTKFYQTWEKAALVFLGLGLVAYFLWGGQGSVADMQYVIGKVIGNSWLRRHLPDSMFLEIVTIAITSYFLGIAFSLGRHLRIFYFIFSVFRWFFTINIFARIFVLIVALSTVNAFAYTCYVYDVIYLSTFREIVGGLRYVWNGVILYCIVTIAVWLFTDRDARSDHYDKPGQSLFTFPRSLRHPNEIKMDKEIEADTRRKNGE